LPKTNRKMSRIGRPKRKWMKFEVTETMGRTSAGKRIFLMRLPLTIRTLAESFNDDENHVQGRIPANKYRAYIQGPSPRVGSRGLRMNPKTTV